jgi:hypothetical protein
VAPEFDPALVALPCVNKVNKEYGFPLPTIPENPKKTAFGKEESTRDEQP